MNNRELKLEVVSPTTIQCGHIEWFGLDTKLVGKIKALIEENEKFKNLCNKYEEEQKTTYEIWKKDINLYNSIVDRIDKTREILKDTSVDMPETLLIETIDYARHILNGGDDNECKRDV